jgi:hypothetical protein
MADSDLLYDPYAGYELNHVRRSSDVGVDSLSAGLDVGGVEGNSHPILSTKRNCSSPVEHRDNQSFGRFSPRKLRAISICLHLLLVLVHVGLFVVWRGHFEHRVIVPLSRSGNTSSAIVVISQIFATVCISPRYSDVS